MTKVVCDTDFELNIAPFLGLHLVFNVALLRPYLPPLLDTSKTIEKLKLTKLNPECMQQESGDHIVDTEIKGTRQQMIHLYRVVKAGCWGSEISYSDPPFPSSFFTFHHPINLS
jgi:hypothetical protein